MEFDNLLSHSSLSHTHYSLYTPTRDGSHASASRCGGRTLPHSLSSVPKIVINIHTSKLCAVPHNKLSRRAQHEGRKTLEVHECVPLLPLREVECRQGEVPQKIGAASHLSSYSLQWRLWHRLSPILEAQEVFKPFPRQELQEVERISLRPCF